MRLLLHTRISFVATVAVALFSLASNHCNAETFEITLDGINFEYDGAVNSDIDLTIQTGDTLRWTWVSGLHNIASGFPPEPNGGELFFSGDPVNDVGTSFEFTFDQTGIFGYHCEVHESLGMFSSVTVIPEPSTLVLAGIACIGLFYCRRK